MILLEAEPLDLGAEIRAVGIELVEDDENREPVRGEEAAKVWSRVLPAIAGHEPWAIDFFSHLDRVREYCKDHRVGFSDATQHCVVVPAPEQAKLEALLARFETETFGARAGTLVTQGDASLERDLAHRGADAYDHAFPNYLFCAICDFENGSLVVLSQKLWASEIIRLARRALNGLEVDLRLATA